MAEQNPLNLAENPLSWQQWTAGFQSGRNPSQNSVTVLPTVLTISPARRVLTNPQKPAKPGYKTPESRQIIIFNKIDYNYTRKMPSLF